MNPTKIEYLDYTWNPFVGCSGKTCAVAGACWARGQAKRQKPGEDKNGKVRGCRFCYEFKPHYHFERFHQPQVVKKPSRIGVGFMGDIFDSAFGICMLQQLFEIMELASWHTFLCLTKQSRNMLTFNRNWQRFPVNVWMGVSVNNVRDIERIRDLQQTDALVKFVSFEPLFADLKGVDLSGIDWIIVGAQKRPDVQPKRAWVLDLEKVARAAGAKIFRKNNLSGFSRLQEIPEVKINA